MRNGRKLATILVPSVFAAASSLFWWPSVIGLGLWLTLWPLWLSCEIET